MFEKISQAAEQVATSVSRRAFLGKFGRKVLAVSGVVAAAVAGLPVAEAGGGRCCCGVFGGDIFDCYRRPRGVSQCETGYRSCRCTNDCRR